MRSRLMHVLRALVTSAALCAGVVLADATWEVETLIPELIAMRVPTTTIAFGFDAETYPPDAFPARYPAILPEDGLLPVQVFSNAEGTWSLVLEVPDLVDDVSGARIPADQLVFRVDEGLWLRGSVGPQIVVTRVGPTDGWLDVRIEFALELTGAERAGSYRVDAIVSAFHDGE